MKNLKSIFLFSILLSLGVFLLACTKTPEVSLEFNTNGGSLITPILTDGKSISLPNNPTKDGYIFDGWYWDNETFTEKLTNKSIPESKIAATMTVYAKWIPATDARQFTITFDSMGGTPVEPITADFQSAIQKPTDPTMDGLSTFDNWYIDQDYTTPYIFTTMPETNITLYAKWNTLGLVTAPIEITMWHIERTTKRDLLIKYANEFMNLYPHITVNIPDATSSLDILKNSLQSSFAHNTAKPNIIEATAYNLAEYKYQSFILNLNPYINDPTYGLSNSESLEDILLSFREESSQYDANHNFYGLPFSKSTEVMIYNQTAFTSINKEIPKTWNDVISITPFLRTYGAQYNNLSQVIPVTYDSAGNAFITFIKQFDGAYTSLNYNTMTGECLWEDNVNTIEAMNFLKTNKGSITTPQFWNEDYGTNPFMQQKTLALISSSSEIRYNIPPINPNTGQPIFEIGVAPIPYNSELSDSKAVLQKGLDLALVNTGTDQEKLASWLFLKFITNTENSADWAINTGSIPIRTSAFQTAPYQEFLNNPTTAQKYTSMVANAMYLQLDDMFFAPSFIRSEFVREKVGYAIERILYGDGNIDAALEDAVVD
ncbi:MAG: hypothetical protein CVV57_01455 [Tenericutes bacterium HGW-Tenericutes-2]|jgi:uncharacterized repeat protein (TIGR02543 family)|nr:MAG: hypothetical protein CVV57_01455 [Tenericutes bacterium HGW-Tenericutes-2]